MSGKIKLGRPRKHAAWDLEVGGETVIRCEREKMDRLRSNILAAMRPSRTNMRFTTGVALSPDGEFLGLRVRRLA